MRFLTDLDYNVTIRNEIRALLTKSDAYTQETAEATALDLVSSYLRDRYQVDEIFVPVPLFVAGTTYNTGDSVDSGGKIYTAIVDNAGDTLTDLTKWKVSDPRSKLLIRVLIDITLYDLHSNISPRNIPPLREKRYNEAMSWLKGVQSNKINPGLESFVTEGQEGGGHFMSSNEKYSEKW